MKEYELYVTVLNLGQYVMSLVLDGCRAYILTVRLGDLFLLMFPVKRESILSNSVTIELSSVSLM